MDDLKVPKRQVSVEVVLPGGISRDVTLFLGEHASSHDGPERLSDLLNGRDPFIPALDLDGGGMTFLQRASVVMVRTSDAVEPDDFAFTPPVEHRVAITLLDGARVTGTIAFVAPPGARLVEFLNRPEPFFRVVTADGVALVARAHVARVALVER